MKFHSWVSISVREKNTIFNSVITLENTICKPRSVYGDLKLRFRKFRINIL